MDFWIKAAQLLLSLSLLVVLHEFGHFIPARLFKTRVEKFYLFFNWKFSLFKKKIGDTEWGIGWIPLGGYVKIAGMIDESMDKDQMAKEPQPWEFRSKPAWQRLIIMVGGVVVNIIVGMLIYIFVLFTWGEDKLHTKDLQSGLSIHPYLEKYDIRSGDNILEINDLPVEHYNDINNGLLLRDQRKLKVQRPNGEIEIITLPEGIDFELFRNGAFPSVGLRHKSIVVEHVISVDKQQDLGIKKSDLILKINGKLVKDIDFSIEKYDASGTNDILIKRGKDEQTLKINDKDMAKLFSVAPALKGGIHQGDKILAVGDSPVEFFDEIVGGLYQNKNKNVDLMVLRGQDTLTKQVRVSSLGSIGFAPKNEDYIDRGAIQSVKYSFGQSFYKGIGKGYTTLSDYSSQLKFLFTKKGASSMGGFGALGNLFPSTWDWQIFWMNTALISIILAFMNILPIPALDGGHVVFLLYEIITGREAPQKVLEYAQYIGFFLILGLVIYANGNDIYRWLFGG